MQPTGSRQMQQTVAELMPQFMENSFVKEIATGSLSRAAVVNYVQQDNLYLDRFLTLYQQVLGALNPSLLEQTEHDIQRENGAHQVLLKVAQTTTDQIMTPVPAAKQVTKAYLEHMERSAEQSAFLGLASMQACPAVYSKLAQRLVQQGANQADNPFADWINFYVGTDDDFNHTMFHELDQLSPTVTAAERQQAQQVFRKSCELELAFFTQAEEDD
ncbi:TenA family protein [Fructilactobacillus carniphilus]|uniref:Aminopyrimidine aminohydrolase n=1 Tax=Fructilactobacillus carniphilus TaxID=2940297 RepID=A0ABY5BUZ3_9LACO|nr:TenA family protein [Fructilactobacillus carniphilus]USS90320.1 TenA family protein [Fructilactobacillus carniphilus]